MASFQAALYALNEGKRVSRTGWNGKGMWLKLVSGGEYELAPGLLDNIDENPFNPRMLPWIGMKTADGGFVPWLASQTDILSADWGVLDEVEAAAAAPQAGADRMDSMMKQAQAHFDNEPETEVDPLAGLGLRVGDLEAVREQVMQAFRPLQREHYRAMVMCAVIQGSIAADKALPPESMAKTAMHYADAACKELGL